MGCWNESCALSGIDLPHRTEIYVALLGNERFGNDVEIFVPPIRGVYDDYGGIDLLEDAPLFGLKKGENWRPRDDQRGHPAYLDAEIFDFLVNLECDFPSHDGKTIGEGLDAQEAKLREFFAKAVAFEHDNEDPEKRKAFWELTREIEDLVGRRRESFYEAYRLVQEQLWRPKDPKPTVEEYQVLVDTFITSWRRARILRQAQHELRKKVVAGISGPQHGGAPALIAFYDRVLNISKRRDAEQRDECWNYEHLDKVFSKDRWKAEVALDQTDLSFRDWQSAKATTEENLAEEAYL